MRLQAMDEAKKRGVAPLESPLAEKGEQRPDLDLGLPFLDDELTVGLDAGCGTGARLVRRIAATQALLDHSRLGQLPAREGALLLGPGAVLGARGDAPHE